MRRIISKIQRLKVFKDLKQQRDIELSKSKLDEFAAIKHKLRKRTQNNGYGNRKIKCRRK